MYIPHESGPHPAQDRYITVYYYYFHSKLLVLIITGLSISSLLQDYHWLVFTKAFKFRYLASRGLIKKAYFIPSSTKLRPPNTSTDEGNTIRAVYLVDMQ